MSTELTATPTIAKRIIKMQALYHMREAVEGNQPKNLPIFLHSSPGVGKSAITAQSVEEISNELFGNTDKEVGFIDVRLGCYEASDVQGIPYVAQYENHQTGESGEVTRQDMLFSVPKWWPTDPDSCGILFFDELSNADISTQHAAYQIIHDRAIHELKLPKGWFIVAAGNRLEDKTGAKKIAPALANRFGTHIVLETTVDSWMDYAASNGIHREVIGFLNFKPDYLYKYDPKNNRLAFPTPRSWEHASNFLHRAETLDYSEAESDLNLILSGCLGDGVASDFMAFRRFFDHLPNFQKIMDGKEKYTVPKGGDQKQGILYALVSSLFQHVKEQYEDEKRLENLAAVVRQLPDEFCMLFFRFLKKSPVDMQVNVFEVLEDKFSDLERHLG